MMMIMIKKLTYDDNNDNEIHMMMMIERKTFHPNSRDEVNRRDCIGQVFGHLPVELPVVYTNAVLGNHLLARN